jgi:hypothetical protein
MDSRWVMGRRIWPYEIDARRCGSGGRAKQSTYRRLGFWGRWEGEASAAGVEGEVGWMLADASPLQGLVQARWFGCGLGAKHAPEWLWIPAGL